jgi:hypothetical protein
LPSARAIADVSVRRNADAIAMRMRQYRRS